MGEGNSQKWPRKHNVLGVGISATNYDDTLIAIINAANEKRSTCVTHLAVHGLVLGSQEQSFRSTLNEFDIVAPDGQPIRLALNLLYKTKLQDRCYGPEFMIRVCRYAATEGIGVYLYGSYLHVVASLRDNLVERYPGLLILGCEPSVFRPLTKDEDEALIQRINNSGASIVFVGLGCPIQEKFAFNHREKISAVQVCVGAAFDFHAGNKKMAPKWMQNYSLEWLYRLLQSHRGFGGDILQLIHSS